MSDFGIFIGFGIPVPGREVAAAKVFGEAVGYYERLARVRGSEEFAIYSLRAAYAVQNVGVVTALLDTEAGRFVAAANDITADLRG